jgi:hypothetical protein
MIFLTGAKLLACQSHILVDKLNNSKHDDVRHWAQIIQNNDASIEDFVARTQRHDKYRGNDFYKTFPELRSFIEEINNDN